ncbi:MAG: hypothetical protein R2874_15200 [Desulfobacterales bacterium]
MALRGRFRHLLKPEYADVVDAFQKKWTELALDHQAGGAVECWPAMSIDFDGEVLMRCI